MLLNSCIYCGEASQCLDHVIPYSYTSAISYKYRNGGSDPGFRVPACTQCNCILGDRIFRNLVERKEYIHKRLFVRLRKYVSCEKWEDHEIEGLGRNLRSTIEIGEAKADIAEDRLNYSAGPPEARWTEMEERWRELYKDESIPESKVRAVS